MALLQSVQPSIVALHLLLPSMTTFQPQRRYEGAARDLLRERGPRTNHAAAAPVALGPLPEAWSALMANNDLKPLFAGLVEGDSPGHIGNRL